MAGLEEIQNVYQTYLEEAWAAEETRKPGEGIFGFGKRPSDDPCHERFCQRLKETLGEAERDLPEILAYIYRAPLEHPEPKSAYWMLVAAHGFTLDLIPRLSREEAAALGKEFQKHYRRWERTPVQEQVLSALQKV